MLRTFILTIYFLFSLYGSHPVAAQTYPNLPSRIVISSSARALRVGQLAEIRIALLDQQGGKIGAAEDTQINLICTKLKDLRSARGDAHQGQALEDGVLELPLGGINTVQWSLAIPSGQTEVTVRFRSQQAGTLRLFAENEKLVAGSTLIAVIRDISRTAQTSAFRTVSFQEEPTSSPCAQAGPTSCPCALSIEQDGTEIPPFINGESVRKLNVQLNSGADPVPACEPVDVLLKIESGQGTLSSTSIRIAKGQPMSDVIELRTGTGGEVKVSARVVRTSQFSVSPAQTTCVFPEARRATKLLVSAVPSAALANGMEAIQLQVKAVDDGNNPIRAEDEGLSSRDVTFKLEGRAFGLKFDKGITKITIPKGEVDAVVSIFGSSSTVGAKVIAESENGSRKAIMGITGIEFKFPWWPLGFAMLGGLIVALLRPIILSKRPRQFDKMRDPAMCLLGLIIGIILFILFFYGAGAMSGFKWNGITVDLARLPLQNVVAAFTIGVFGSLLIDAVAFFAGKRKAARA